MPTQSDFSTTGIQFTLILAKIRLVTYHLMEILVAIKQPLVIVSAIIIPNTSSIPNVAAHKELPKMWIRIDKWGLIFDGNNLRMSVEDFIFRIERLQTQYEIPVEELERDFHLLLSGPAKDWYWLFVQTHFGVKWPGLKQALLSQYQTSRSNFEIMRDLVEKKILCPNLMSLVDQFFHAKNQK
ncbi:hypothetical protein CVS40_11952 [Lucilia cuprina]|nr:hypothetical protein CVS40_11952 [Lucilia cuprina]